MKSLTKEQLSYVYATLLFSKTSNRFFKQFKRLIVRNWSLRALEDIQEKAWRFCEVLSDWEETTGSRPQTEQEITLFGEEPCWKCFECGEEI